MPAARCALTGAPAIQAYASATTAALAGLWQSDADADWTNRIVFLSRAAEPQ
jgi:hypothetical protein